MNSKQTRSPVCDCGARVVPSRGCSVQLATMKRAVLWFRTVTRDISLPDAVAIGGTRGSPCPACTSRCAQRCHNTAAELPQSLRSPSPGSAVPRGCPAPPRAKELHPGGIPRSSNSNSNHSRSGNRQGGHTFASRLVPENPLLVTGLTGVAFCAGLGVGRMCAVHRCSRMAYKSPI